MNKIHTFTEEQALEESTNSPNARPKTATKTTTAERDAASPSPALAAAEPPGSPTTNFLNELLSEVQTIDASSKASVLARRPSALEYHDEPQRETLAESMSSSSAKALRRSTSSSSTTAMPTTSTTTTAQVLTVQARAVRIEFDSTWGDREHVGLAGVEVLGIDGRPMSLQQRWLAFDASSDMFGSGGSGERRVDNVLNRVNNTANDSFMWLAPLPYEKQKKQYLEINFPSERTIVGLR